MYFRFQGTKKIETNSFYHDLEQIYDQLYDDIDEEELEELFDNYKETLSLRENITAEELFNKVVKAESLDDILELENNYKMKGIFAYDLNDVLEFHNCNTIDEAIEYITDNWNSYAGSMVQNDTYLVVFEGEEIANLEEMDDGILVEMNKIVKIIE